MSKKLQAPRNEFFSVEEMVSILELDADYISDEGNRARLKRLSRSVSGFLLNRTKYDWSADEPRHPTAIDCAEMWVRMRFYQNTEYAEDYDYSVGISADIRELIMILRKGSE